MKVLLPIDGSDSSQKTLRWAVHFLNKQTARIFLLTIIELPPGVPPIDVDFNKAEQHLKEARNLLESNGYLVEKQNYIIADPAPAICQYAEDEDVDQIIIGSHGKQGVAKFLMGSVSEAVFNHAKRPVLVLKNDHHATIQMSHTDKVSLNEVS
jgi:nucleotide-binding universal stress UspA family protein